MISDQQFREFGFDKDQFPRKLVSQAVTLGLPASAPAAAAVTVLIERGLLVPTQAPGAPNGMVIKDDGTMVYVVRENPDDPSSALKASFIDNIPYDARIEVYNIMKRAVEVDPGLSDVWAQIQARWVERFSAGADEVQRQDRGRFSAVTAALDALRGLIDEFMIEVDKRAPEPDQVPLKIIVQTQEELGHGWQGEEFCVDTSSIGQIRAMGPQKYQEDLARKLKAVLKNPVFHSRSSFRIFYEPRMVPAVKLIVVPPDDPGSQLPQGIDF